jgi:hypothetical protein
VIGRRLAVLATLLAAATLIAACSSTPDEAEETAVTEAPPVELPPLVTDPCADAAFAPVLVENSTIVKTSSGPARALLERIRSITEVLATVETTIYLRVSASPDEVRAAMIGIPTFAPSVDLVEPEHLYTGGQVSSVGPVDEPTGPIDETANSVVAGGPARQVAVIDAATEAENPATRHSEFVLGILADAGAGSELFAVPPYPSQAGDGPLQVAEGDLIIAAGDVRNAILSGKPIDTVLLPVGSYGCDEYEPGRALHSILDTLAVPVVAPAGNDGVDQPVYPAARHVGVGSASPAGPRSCFSNYGAWVDHWVVGQEVVGRLDGREVTWSGTSFAAALAAASELADLNPSANGTDRTPANVAEGDGHTCPGP